MEFKPYTKLKEIYVNIRNYVAHKKVDNKIKLYGHYQESPVLHSLIDNNYKAFKNFNKISRRANRNPKRVGNLEDISQEEDAA
jgi:hypothetical protein